MAVRLTTDITIGNFRFSGVHEARIKRSLGTYVDMAWLILPSKARIVRKDGKRDLKEVITGQQFNDGDKVVIKLGYDGDNRTEFEGFVKRRNFNMPFEIEMEGYSYQLRRKYFKGGFWKQVSVKELLQKAVEGTNITLKCDADVQLTNIKINEGSAILILETILKATNGSLSIFFLESKVLYCGLIYTPYNKGEDALGVGKSKYRIGFNCPQQNHLRQRAPINDPVTIKAITRLSDGTKLEAESKNELAGYTKRIVFKNIRDKAQLQKAIDNIRFRKSYEGYEGRLTAFLKPETYIGYVSFIKHSQYPDRDGYYVVEATEVEFGSSGARRFIDVAHKIGVI